MIKYFTSKRKKFCEQYNRKKEKNTIDIYKFNYNCF